MKNIKITTDRGPWLGGGPAKNNSLHVVDDETAAILVSRRWAEYASKKADASEKADK